MSFSSLRNFVDKKINAITDTVSDAASDLEKTLQNASSELEQIGKGIAADVAGQFGINTDKLKADGTLDQATIKADIEIIVPSFESAPGPVETQKKDPRNFIPGETLPPWPNELEPFTSMNVITELACLTVEEINNPETTIRVRPPLNTILRSGGGLGSSKVQTLYETAVGSRIEYYIDDIEIKSIIAPNSGTGLTNAQIINFKVSEPYSMGMFIETLHLAAKRSGHRKFTEAVFLLTIDFKGWNENNETEIAPYSRRMIPIKIEDIQFEVTASGSEYSVQATAFNDEAFRDTTQQIKTDVSLTGRTVQEVLQTGASSLSTIINSRLIDLEDKNQVNTADQYVIMFPQSKNNSNPAKDSAITAETNAAITNESQGVQNIDVLYQTYTGNTDAITPDTFGQLLSELEGKVSTRTKLGEIIRAFAESKSQTNKIGQRKIIQSPNSPGKMPQGTQKETYNEETGIYERSKINTSTENRKFNYKAGTRIQDIIEDVVITSDYGRGLVKQLENIEKNDGLIDWFKIESQVFYISDNSNISRTGKVPKVFVYRVVPYKIHHEKMKAPTAKGFGYGTLKKQVAKEYNYIYTGQNKDILDFQLKFDLAFSASISADYESNASTDRLGAQNTSVTSDPKEIKKQGEGDSAYSPTEGTPTVEQLIKMKKIPGGAGIDDIDIRIARTFNNILTDPESKYGDMQLIDITIMGDPFYLSDSGLGNYNAQDTSFTNINADGTMNYQNGQVDINILFRTPVDYNKEGLMDFPENYGIVKPFSGLYSVEQVLHSISGNQFTQTLTCARRKGQDYESIQSNVGLFQTGDAKSNVNDAPSPEKSVGNTPGTGGTLDNTLVSVEGRPAQFTGTPPEEETLPIQADPAPAEPVPEPEPPPTPPTPAELDELVESRYNSVYVNEYGFLTGDGIDPVTGSPRKDMPLSAGQLQWALGSQENVDAYLELNELKMDPVTGMIRENL